MPTCRSGRTPITTIGVLPFAPLTQVAWHGRPSWTSGCLLTLDGLARVCQAYGISPSVGRTQGCSDTDAPRALSRTQGSAEVS
jgi:hypothetical protein